MSRSAPPHSKRVDWGGANPCRGKGHARTLEVHRSRRRDTLSDLAAPLAVLIRHPAAAIPQTPIIAIHAHLQHRCAALG